MVGVRLCPGKPTVQWVVVALTCRAQRRRRSCLKIRSYFLLKCGGGGATWKPSISQSVSLLAATVKVTHRRRTCSDMFVSYWTWKNEWTSFWHTCLQKESNRKPAVEVSSISRLLEVKRKINIMWNATCNYLLIGKKVSQTIFERNHVVLVISIQVFQSTFVTKIWWFLS